MAVQIDERRNDRLAARVDDPCILGVADRSRRSDSAYDAARDDESRILDRRLTRAVNQARAFEDNRAGRFEWDEFRERLIAALSRDPNAGAVPQPAP